MYILLVLFFVALDQISKYYALNYLASVHSIPIIQNIFNLTYVENKGAAFGILQNKKYFFVIIAAFISGVIIYTLYTNKNLDRYTKFGLILVLSGAIGNVIDRVRLGFVVDFLDFIIWPVFNVADICVVTGGIILSIKILFSK